MNKHFTISLKVYKKERVLKAIEDISEEHTIELSDNELIVHGSNDEEIEAIFQEFMNYVLYV